MAIKRNAEVWIIMNEDGEYTAASTLQCAEEEFSENFGGTARRVVKLNITMTPPPVIEADIEIADETGEISANTD